MGPTREAEAHLPDHPDGLLWLEELDSEVAMAWVRARNEEAIASLTGNLRFEQLRAESLQVLDSDARIPYPTWRGQYLYNLWRDEAHPRGLWRRTTLADYRRANPSWQVLLDLDALAAAEGENWVWQGASRLRPDNRRFLVSLSRGGSDASVVREFDIDTRSFVEDGFAVPEAKSTVCWIDSDRVYVATDFGPGSLTSSGYPRLVKQWHRGTPLGEASLVFAGETDDVSVQAWNDQTPGFRRDFVTRNIDFYRSETYLRPPEGDLVRIEVPDDAVIDIHRQWLLVRLRSPWQVGASTFPTGAVLVTDLAAFLAGERDLTMAFEPDERTALSQWAWTLNDLILVTLTDVCSRLVVLTPGERGWRRADLTGVGVLDHTSVADTNPDHSDEYLLASTGFTQPATLRYGRGDGDTTELKSEPVWFDAAGISVRQHFATSADGTRVPYFVVGGSDVDRAGPTLLNGYGGFEVSRTPYYDGVIGRGWLARGGTFVLANIRGGGEYGPRWHHAALRENRPRAFEDFAAVAADLHERGIATPSRLGIEGGSNGGLLMGAMLTRYPRLFGAIVIKVPLLDLRRYHKLLAGASWIAEYGDPDNEADWAFLRGFSPYHHVRAGQPYPPVLLITSTRDDRVHPGHARKMAALLREHGYDVTYYENVEGGHGAAADNAQMAFQSALKLEFLWQRLR